MITLDRDLCFLDTETLGLDPAAPIWEFAAIRLNRDGTRDELHCQILHQSGHWLDTLPERFADDYRARFGMQAAIPPAMAAREIQAITDGTIIAGSNPAFDTERLTRLLARCARTPTWYFHSLDIPSMALGNLVLQARLIPGGPTKPGVFRSIDLSRGVCVDPDDYARHTAMGDVEWCLAQWRVMTGAEDFSPIITGLDQDDYPIGEVRG